MIHHLAIARLCSSFAATATDARTSVEAGAEALSRSDRYPWYDSQADEVVHFEMESSWDWSGFRLFSIPGNVLSIAGWVFLGIILAIVLYVVISTILRSMKTPPAQPPVRPRTDQRRLIEALPVSLGRKKVGLLGEAERLYHEGDFTEAVIYLFSHELVQLDKHQLIHLTKGKTNRQYLRELGRQPGLKRIYEQTMLVFEDAFFGSHTIGRERFEAVWARVEEFDALAVGANGG